MHFDRAEERTMLLVGDDIYGMTQRKLVAYTDLKQRIRISEIWKNKAKFEMWSEQGEWLMP